MPHCTRRCPAPSADILPIVVDGGFVIGGCCGFQSRVALQRVGAEGGDGLLAEVLGENALRAQS